MVPILASSFGLVQSTRRALGRWLVCAVAAHAGTTTALGAQGCAVASRRLLASMEGSGADSIAFRYESNDEGNRGLRARPKPSWLAEIQPVLWCGVRVAAASLSVDARAVCRQINESPEEAGPLCAQREARPARRLGPGVPVTAVGGALRRVEVDDGFGGQVIELELRFVDGRNGRSKNVRVVMQFFETIPSAVIIRLTTWGIS